MAIKRVEKRVLEGGHHIPEEVIRRRYNKGIDNLKLFIDVVDNWFVVNNSDAVLEFIAEGDRNEIIIFDQQNWKFLS